MGTRIDDMEKHIGELMKQTGVEPPPADTAAPTSAAAAPAVSPPAPSAQKRNDYFVFCFSNGWLPFFLYAA